MTATLVGGGLSLGALLGMSGAATAQTTTQPTTVSVKSCPPAPVIPTSAPLQWDGATTAAASGVAAAPAQDPVLEAATSSPTVATTTGALAFTGTNVAGISAVGGGLVLLGGLMVRTTKRRQGAESI